MSDWDMRNVGAVLDDPRKDWFTARLMRLIHKADAGVRDQLRRGFPEEVEAVERYEGAQKKPITELMDELEVLIAKADFGNMARLTMSLPDEVAMIHMTNGWK